MAFTKITHAGIGSTGTVLLENLEVTGVGTFGGSVSVGGTLTYEDVTNVDSVGLITARNGIVVGSGITLSKDGDGFFTGIVTATFAGDGTNLTGVASTDNIRSNTNATFLQNINVSGTSTVGGDVNIADKIVHIGDTNTTIRFPAADTITSETGGSERLRIDSSGNTNFGAEKSVALPSGTGIQVYHSANPRIKLVNDTTGNGATDGTQIYLSNDGDTIIDNKDSEDIIFHSNASEKLRIGTSGQIGIAGANYGSSGQVLTSGGSGSAVSWTTVSGTTINSNADNRLITGSGTANTLNGESGLTYDGSTLQVSGNVDLSDNNKLMIGDGDDLQIDHSGTNSQIYHNGAGGLYIATLGSGEDLHLQSTSGKITFTTGGSERLRVTDDGIKFNGDNAAANALDDYEEGTYDGTLSVTSGTLVMDTSKNQLSYTKIGRQCTITGRVQVSSVSGLSGYMTLNLPFAVGTSTEYDHGGAGSIFMYNAGGVGSPGYSGLWVVWTDGGLSQIYFTYGDSTTAVNGAKVSAGTEVRVTFTYFVS